MSSYRLENDTFVIENFDKKPPFCSFLPGLTGERGIPVWSFYVNRGQGITAFGVENKQQPIMQVTPANVAYEDTAIKGFRTFIRKNGEYFEPFFIRTSDDIERNMYIKQNSMKVVEIDKKHQFKTTVEYFILPNDTIGAIVRDVKFENLGERAEFEILDGMPKIIPAGVSLNAILLMSNLNKSYNTILNLENKIPVFLKEIIGDDHAEVHKRTDGYYYFSFDNDGLIAPIYDPNAIFDEETSLIYPVNFASKGLDFVVDYKQNGTNKFCGSFASKKIVLDKGETYRVVSMSGHTHSPEIINEKAKEINFEYIDKKLVEADGLATKFTDDIATKSSNPVLDMYFRQCYLDNFLRGGYPFVFKGKDKNKVVHLFSRKHGDPERDYNHFSIAAEYYSQGDGNFRDVLQNRRNDVLFHPDVNDFNIQMFFSYIQFNGYNPLHVQATSFSIPDEFKVDVDALIENYVADKKDVVSKILGKKFTPGILINGIFNNKVKLNISDDEFLAKVLEFSVQNFEGKTDKEGNWSDHFDYLIDLIDTYKMVYPDKIKELVFDNNEYTYFDSEVFINPRSIKYVFDGKEPKQLYAYNIDEFRYEKDYKLDKTNWLRDKNGKVYKTNLIEKLMSLCVNKVALLDHYQMGIEMEANRVGWCDATSGLPGMFGSGMSETFELLRVLRFTLDIAKQYSDKYVTMPVELFDFYNKLNDEIKNYKDEYSYWDKVSTIREEFREKTRTNIDGEVVEIKLDEVISPLESYIDLVEKAIDKALKFDDGFCPTYFKYEPVSFEIVKENEDSYDNIKVNEFKPVKVAKFLEGPTKYIRDCGDKEKAKEMLEKVKSSNVYDKKLKMYKTCESLKNEGLQFGRIAAFTPGWQENESIFLHMEYKFLLSILQSGLYKEFYEEMKNVMIPFLDPAVYGRSTLENSSFIASSANPDENIHGRGFVSRLTGSTTEAISMWVRMYLGTSPFVVVDGKLGLKINPILAGEMFDENGEVSFNFLTTNKVTVHNPSKEDTFDKDVKYIVIDGESFDGDTAFGEVAYKVRDQRTSDIHIYY